jgi:NAD(P)H-nitrite reductase large subunit
MSDDIAAETPCFVCRCEEVDESELRQAIAAGARTINDIKRRTHAGMGICQGVYCLHQVAALLAREAGQQVENVLPMTARPPVRLLTLGALSGDEPVS